MEFSMICRGAAPTYQVIGAADSSVVRCKEPSLMHEIEYVTWSPLRDSSLLHSNTVKSMLLFPLIYYLYVDMLWRNLGSIECILMVQL
jgi:hypothetical protein